MARGIRAGLSVVSVLNVVWWGGCATNQSGQAKEATKTVTAMQSARQELAKAQAQLDEVLAAMDQLAMASAAELPRTYKGFTKQVARTVKQFKAAQRRADEMRTRWRQYIDSWEKETEQLSSPELRAKAVERRQAAEKNYDRLREAARAMDQAYRPFLMQLGDVQKALSLDLTPAGVKAAQPAFGSVRKSAADLKQQIASFMGEIDQVMAVSPPPK
jgi:chromosome segregation ATPase